VVGRRAQAGCLIRSTLIFQLSDLKLKPRYSTLAAVSPVLKGLRVLEEFWRMAEFDHLRTKHLTFGTEAILQDFTTRRRLQRILSYEQGLSGSLASLSAFGSLHRTHGTVANSFVTEFVICLLPISEVHDVQRPPF
jgi:hypothetical protein